VTRRTAAVGIIIIIAQVTVIVEPQSIRAPVLGTELLEDAPHRMITLTVPKRIRSFFLWDRKRSGLLALCAALVIKTFYREMITPHELIARQNPCPLGISAS